MLFSLLIKVPAQLLITYNSISIFNIFSFLQASVSPSSSTAIGNKGLPPPVPPNKPAMSALYKPITTALKSIGGGGAGNNDHQQSAGMTVGDTKNN